ncbi:thioredoxin-like protein [Viridothelium virens]|uniref:Thioredoxin-like protein n=1 Tax=Viridothelium virens TaxID=1048519 RepID=A0A6A6GZW2_VIRVR|nr:thioredoxin-like protein [Viridothelium virens]
MPSPGSITEIASSKQLSTLLSSHTTTILDFHAPWCGPCHTIAPLFSSLATQHATPQRLAFAKVDVDAQPDIARQYGVSAMPTFLVVGRSGGVKDTIRGANPGALKAAVEKAAREAKSGAPGGGAGGAAFQSKGRTLGSATASSRQVGGGGGLESWMRGFRTGMGSGSGTVGRGGFVETIVRFLGLYFTTLLSLDAGAAAEASPFSVKNKGR